MKWLEIFYCYVWYYSQVAVKKTHLRRPFTFVMRDAPWLFWGIITPTVAVTLLLCPVWVRYVVGAIYFMVLAHLWWGSKHIIGQQEEPTFDPLHPVASYEVIQKARRKQ